MTGLCKRAGRTARALPAGRLAAGLTLTELMVALALGLLVTAVAAAALVANRWLYLAQDQSGQLQEAGRTAIEVLSRAVRQAAAETWEREGTAIVHLPDTSASIAGLDNASLKDSTAALAAPMKGVNGSDVLALRFMGAGSGRGGDGTRFDCAGVAVPEPADLEADRGWSIFYVAADKAGEPELRCKYRGSGSWSSEALVRGVESFQVLYGLDTDGDGLPNRYLNATAVSAMEGALPPQRLAAGAGAWKSVVAIRVALLVRSPAVFESADAPREFHLFGQAYSDRAAATDPGTRIDVQGLPAAQRKRLRKLFTATIPLANFQQGGLR